MIRSLSLVSLILPALFLAPTTASASIAACNVAPLPPMPTTVPAPEMQRAVTVPVSCVDLVAFTERMRRPVAPVAAAPAAPSPTAYTPKTQHDNTPWRFDMNQNGRRMTAQEFDAWMKAKGIRVATGKPGAGASTAAPAPATATPASSAPVQCVPSATVKC